MMGLQWVAGSSLTDAIASCRLGLGFLLEDVPKIRFMVEFKGVAVAAQQSCSSGHWQDSPEVEV
jgi:hypothetical protein